MESATAVPPTVIAASTISFGSGVDVTVLLAADELTIADAEEGGGLTGRIHRGERAPRPAIFNAARPR